MFRIDIYIECWKWFICKRPKVIFPFILKTECFSRETVEVSINTKTHVNLTEERICRVQLVCWRVMEIIPDITTMQCREVSCGEATLEWCGPLWSFEISSWRIGSCLIIFTRTADLFILEPFVGHILKSDPEDNTIHIGGSVLSLKLLS